MSKIILLLLFTHSFLGLYAQNDSIYTIAEQMPYFVSCDTIQGKYQQKKICSDRLLLHTFYTKINLQEKVENIDSDRAVISFVINKKGTIENIQIINSISLNIDQQIITIIKALPRFIPGKIRNKAVNIKMILPIRFHFE